MIATWLAQQVRKAGVDVRLGVGATAADVLALEPDAVVVATGATPASRTSPAWSCRTSPPRSTCCWAA